MEGAPSDAVSQRLCRDVSKPVVTSSSSLSGFFAEEVVLVINPACGFLGALESYTHSTNPQTTIRLVESNESIDQAPSV